MFSFRSFVLAGGACTLPVQEGFVSFVVVSRGWCVCTSSLNDSDSGLPSLGSDHICEQSAGPSGGPSDGELDRFLLLRARVFDFVCEPKVEGLREVTFLLCLTSVIGTRFSL